MKNLKMSVDLIVYPRKGTTIDNLWEILSEYPYTFLYYDSIKIFHAREWFEYEGLYFILFNNELYTEVVIPTQKAIIMTQG